MVNVQHRLQQGFVKNVNFQEKIYKTDLKFFKYQIFLEEYMEQLNKLGEKANSRGLLIYHGLGSGKTCSGLFLAKQCRPYGGNKLCHIILMIPASLILDPWIKEFTRCNKMPTIKNALRAAMEKHKNDPENIQKAAYKAVCAKHNLYIFCFTMLNQMGVGEMR